MRLSPRSKIGIGIILLVLFFLVLNLTTINKEIKNFFYSISSPIQKWFWKIGDKSSDFFEAISEIHPVKSLRSKFNGVKNLKKENEELKLKIQELISENTALKELKKENIILRQALDIGLEKEFKLVLTQVIGKDISQDYLLIEKGSKDGLKKGLPVITQQKALVGRISEVYEDFSKVILISNKESSFDGKILETEVYPVRDDKGEEETPREQISNGVYGIVKGKGENRLNFELLPKDKEIKEGDLVITSVAGGIFPAGIIVGEIEKIKKSDLEPFQEAEIKPAFDISELDFLFIIQK